MVLIFRMLRPGEWVCLLLAVALGGWAAWDQANRSAEPTLVDGLWVPRVKYYSRGRLIVLSPLRAAGLWATLSCVFSWMIALAWNAERSTRGAARAAL
ncbi:hypothetical protein ACYOEI_42240, partial [Singulisphaera rosea]